VAHEIIEPFKADKHATWTNTEAWTDSYPHPQPFTQLEPVQEFSSFSADHEREGGMDQFKTQIVVDSSGTNKWLAPVILYSSCKMDVKYFPFDTQVGMCLCRAHFYTTGANDGILTRLS